MQGTGAYRQARRNAILHTQLSNNDKAMQAVLKRERAAVADAVHHMSQQQWQALRHSLPGLAQSVYVKELLLACYTAATV